MKRYSRKPMRIIKLLISRLLISFGSYIHPNKMRASLLGLGGGLKIISISSWTEPHLSTCTQSTHKTSAKRDCVAHNVLEPHSLYQNSALARMLPH
jgi:hypothetical protein